MSKASPFTGVAFPEGSRKIAFMAYCAGHRNFASVRKAVKNNKSFQGRVPSMHTLRSWAEDGHWNTLADMVDDGILDVLDMEKDPDIREAIKDEATFFRMLLRLRSQLTVLISKKNSPLMPRNSGDAVRFMKFLQDETGKYNARLSDANSRRVAASDDEIPDNVVDMAKRIKKAGLPVTKATIARGLLHSRQK